MIIYRVLSLKSSNQLRFHSKQVLQHHINLSKYQGSMFEYRLNPQSHFSLCVPCPPIQRTYVCKLKTSKIQQTYAIYVYFDDLIDSTLKKILFLQRAMACGINLEFLKILKSYITKINPTRHMAWSNTKKNIILQHKFTFISSIYINRNTKRTLFLQRKYYIWHDPNPNINPNTCHVLIQEEHYYWM